MKLERFAWMLEKRALYFSSVERFEDPSAETRFLADLAAGSLERSFSRFDCSGGQLHGDAIEGIAILLDQPDESLRGHGADADETALSHNDVLELFPTWQAHDVFVHVQLIP